MSTQEQLSYHEKGKRKKNSIFSASLSPIFFTLPSQLPSQLTHQTGKTLLKGFQNYSTNKHRNCRRWNNGHWRQRVKSCESNCQLLRSLFYSFARKRRSRAFRQQQTLANPLAMTAAEEEEKDDDNDNWTTCFTAHLHKRGKQCC